MSGSAAGAGYQTLGLDTDVLVNWAMAGSAHHLVVRRFLHHQIREGRRFGIAQQSLHEFLHVSTDPRRFQQPLTMTEALRITRELWHSSDVERVLPTAEVQDLVCDLMTKFRLGRKRILDTALAATLRSAGITALATFNRSDFELFSFLQVIEPTEEPDT